MDERKIDPKRYLDESYFSQHQWLSVLDQINSVNKYGKSKVLEIGIGNGIVSRILEHIGHDVTTFDINEMLNPDVIGDIRYIDKYFSDNEFEVVLVCEVLEHLEFKYFNEIMKMLCSIASKAVVLTLPIKGKYPMVLSGYISRYPINISVRLNDIIRTPNHYWEIGSNNSTKKRQLVQMLNKYCESVHCSKVKGSAGHMNFTLEKRKL